MDKFFGSVDVVVIGAGTIGTAVSYYLSKYDNKRVMLVDRNQVGTGNTALAASLLTLARSQPDVIAMVSETYRSISNLETELQEPLGLNRVGSIHIAEQDTTVARLNVLQEYLTAQGIANEVMDPEELKEKVPWIKADAVRSAFYTPDDGFIEASILANAFARAARQRGVLVHTGMEVLEILTEGSAVAGVKTDKGIVETPVVVDAAGAWSNLLAAGIKVSLPMAPVRSIYWITGQNTRLFPSSQPMVILPDANAYTRPEGGGLLFGIRDRESTYFHPGQLPPDLQKFCFIEPEHHWDILEQDGVAFRNIFRQFDDVAIAHVITGVSTYTPDGAFIIGHSPLVQGFYAATGCVGAGVATSGGFGRVIAELINGIDPFVDISSFSISRHGNFDPFSAEFMGLCSAYRTRKKDG